YFVIAVPLLVVVPFAAFRSLAGELEDGTFELLSITALSSRQIITGKLGSAILQMLVYYSAMSPCVAFTYLLRGIDIITIVLILAYTFLASLLFAVVGLVVATLSTNRAWQVLFSVLLLLALLAGAGWWSGFMMLMLFESPPLDQWEFWISNVAVITFYVSYFIMGLFAASGLISFASDNRSTRLRWVMLAQQALIVGWLLYATLEGREIVGLFFASGISAVHWSIMGSLLIGESAQLSPRVRRSLPQSFAGRMLLTWFNPGSGTGYVFMASSFGAATWVIVVSGLLSMLTPFSNRINNWDWLWFSLASWCYVIIYLGCARLLFLMLKPYYYVGLLFTFLITVLLTAAGAALPFFLQLWLAEFGRPEYSLLQTYNWIWSLYEIGDGNSWAYPWLLPILMLSAACVFLLNLFFAVKEIEQVRLTTPERVVQDERELHPERFVEKKQATPWDEVD
ncbi:MAG: hypothetical protein KDA59_22670, partial [Planctomycetales bacterium]|nr:hypothetical protein [Planctomycetales bacterium]